MFPPNFSHSFDNKTKLLTTNNKFAQKFSEIGLTHLKTNRFIFHSFQSQTALVIFYLNNRINCAAQTMDRYSWKFIVVIILG